MSAHARLAPSSAPIWGNCSGSVAASVGRTDKQNARTIAGTAAHWVMEQCAKNWRSSQTETDLFCSDWVGKVDPDGTVIDQQIAEGAQYILDDMIQAVSQYGGYSYLLVEQRVQMTRIHPTDNWGTLDLALYNPEWNNGQGVLVIEDYKHGHTLVRAKGNLQLIDYAEGLMESFAIPAGTKVVMRIVQPFAYAPWGPVDEHVCTMGDLFPAFQQLATKAAEADKGGTLSAGKWCRYCPAREDCSAAREYLYLWGSICDMPYHMDRMTLDDKARESDLLADIIKVAQSRKDALDDIVSSEIQAGKMCSVKAFQASSLAPKWNAGQEQAAVMAFKSIGIDIAKPAALTPSQALQKVSKKSSQYAIAEQMVKAMATRKTTTKLIDREDTVVARAFNK